MPPARSARSLLIRFVKFAVVAGALAYLWTSGQLSFDKIGFRPDRWDAFAAGAALMVFTCLTSFTRWYLLLRNAEARIGLFAAWRMGLIGMFFNTFMFGGFGGDLVKLAYVVRETRQRAAAAATVVIDRVSGLLGLLTLGGLAIIWYWPEILATPDLHLLALILFASLAAVSLCLVTAVLALTAGRVWALAFDLVLLILELVALTGERTEAIESVTVYAHLAAQAAVLLAVLTAVLVPSILPGRSLNTFARQRLPGGATLMSFVESFLAFRHHVGALVLTFVLSLFIQGMALFAFYLFAHAMGSAASLAHIFFAAPPAFVANALPVPMGGLGVGESCFGNLLRLCRDAAGAPIEGGAMAFLGWRLLTVLFGVAGGLPLYLWGQKEIAVAEAAFAAETDTAKTGEGGLSA